MLRSEINRYLEEASVFFEKHKFPLPYFARVKSQELLDSREYLKEYSLGWDITDFGSGNFEKIGLLLFTIRNGKYEEEKSKKYAEKIMMVRENQMTPLHFHWKKTEDIINRGGGNLVVKLYQSNEDETLSDADFNVWSDGRCIQCKPGQEITLHPGDSVTLEPYVYHAFWGESGSGHVMVGEVSETSDDISDNRFYENQPRFSEINEDEEKQFTLVNEY